MSVKNVLILAVFCLSFLNGCSIPSEIRSMTPHFSGTLKFGEQAINNAKIMLSTEANDKYCFKAKKFTSSDKQGKFNLSAITEKYTYTPFMSNQLDEWTVCAKYNDDIYTLYSNNRYGSGNVTGSTYLDCNLALSPSNKSCSISR